MGLHQATDLLDDPGRPPGWTFIDPVILQGWGRGSAVVPGALASAVPELAGVRSFLDVGSGIGLLAVAAAGVWPQATVVGIDVWGPSLEAAAANDRVAGLGDRIILRDQDVAALDDSDAYDCAWFPRSSSPSRCSRRPCHACTGRCAPAAGSCSGGWHPRPTRWPRQSARCAPSGAAAATSTPTASSPRSKPSAARPSGWCPPGPGTDGVRHRPATWPPIAPQAPPGPAIPGPLVRCRR